jgi:TPR repeat protein
MAEAKRAEEARLAEEQRKVEEARKAEEARKLAEARRAEEERRAAEAQRLTAVGKPADERAAAEQRAAALNQGGGAKAPAPSLPQARLDHLLAQGDRHLADGNLVIARQYYLRAAQAGMARAALRLAETYDPNELRRLNVRGLLPDVAEAKRWYAQAIALGETGAQIKLGRLQEK